MILIGNWKMAPEKERDAVTLFKKTLAIARTYKKIHFVSVVPSLHFPSLVKQKQTTLSLGLQSVASSDAIAQTGRIGAGMAKSYGARYAIAGHSERRAQGETDDDVRDQVTLLLQKKIIPIVCVGEKERDAHGWYLSMVKEQVEKAIKDRTAAQVKQMIIAYEPVWAIGSAAVREATALECREMIIFIRRIIADMYTEKDAQKVVIIYGGSVDENNVDTFVTEGGAQGFLVGRVSLDPRRFGVLAKRLATSIKA